MKLLTIKARRAKCTKLYDSIAKTPRPQINFQLKTCLNIIYQYHNSNKKILFVGFSNNKKLNRQLKIVNHIFIPNKTWIKGLISNIRPLKNKLNKLLTTFPTMRKKPSISSLKIDTMLYSFNERPHLIVIFNPDLESPLITESYQMNIPIITFGKNPHQNVKVLYELPLSLTCSNQRILEFYKIMLASIVCKKPIEKF